ncbi:PepSY domain-containing protein [Streptomyces sp. NPDC051907]|uniref:PepSY domain-containing protein n=1 Tax=Streptomyces sp. NPDC051907 TaxID=3155284 RepID=UPI0034359459
MKRNLVIATLAAAVLVGGGTYTAAAVTADDSPQPPRQTASEAAAAALKQTPGTVDSVEVDDDDAPSRWEVKVLGEDDDREHDLKVDPKTGTARDTGTDADDDADDRRDHAALRAAKIDATQAIEKALRTHPGTATSIEFDDAHWEVEIHTKSGAEDEVRVNAQTGKTTTSPDTDTDTDDASDD